MITHYDLLKSEADQLPIRYGNLIFVRDNGDILYDNTDGTRTSMKENVIILSTEASRTGMMAPLSGRLYCVLESGKMYVYDTDWVVIGSKTQYTIRNVVLSDFTNNTVTVTDSNIKAYHTAEIIPDLSIAEEFSSFGISVSSISNGSITIRATTPPSYPIFVEINLL